MTNAEHILAWGVNDPVSYDRLLALRASPNGVSLKPLMAVHWAVEVVYKATEFCDMHMSDVTPKSILEAAILALETEI